MESGGEAVTLHNRRARTAAVWRSLTRWKTGGEKRT